MPVEVCMRFIHNTENQSDMASIPVYRSQLLGGAVAPHALVCWFHLFVHDVGASVDVAAIITIACSQQFAHFSTK